MYVSGNLVSKYAFQAINISQSYAEYLLELLHGIIWISNRVTNRPRIGKDLIIVTTLIGLVAKEVNSGIGHSTRLLSLILKHTQAVRLVPTSREDIEGDLATNREAMQSAVSKAPMLRGA